MPQNPLIQDQWLDRELTLLIDSGCGRIKRKGRLDHNVKWSRYGIAPVDVARRWTESRKVSLCSCDRIIGIGGDALRASPPVWSKSYCTRKTGTRVHEQFRRRELPR
ncbi:unnamed protein product [Chondrus crispus]|uniref:Uncharacterized protein n=1 Tax=Chondrus crispus TaxID=2769 RepID=R7Q4I9_CHOCR|nr:unnamed protein product [Chondrus crispus]CDF33437.1 unnamed protein product [Chondrus crispus]|eukprot:XP_005713240.1 unnamed protein product [Chondrus crispus]